MKKLILALALLWPVAGAADFNAGLQAAERGDFATAMREWRPLAEAGDADAQYNLGIIYGSGYGVAEDSVQAYAWFSLAAAQGNKSALGVKENAHKLMSPAQIAEAQKLHQELCTKIPHCTQ